MAGIRSDVNQIKERIHDIYRVFQKVMMQILEERKEYKDKLGKVYDDVSLAIKEIEKEIQEDISADKQIIMEKIKILNDKLTKIEAKLEKKERAKRLAGKLGKGKMFMG